MLSVFITPCTNPTRIQCAISRAVRCTIFLTDMGDFAAVNEIYAEYFTEPYAARAAVAVAALPKGADVEIEVIAHY